MPRPKLSVDQQTALKLRLERGEKTLEELAREFKVSSKTIQNYKKVLLAPSQVQLKKYDTDSTINELKSTNLVLNELVRQLSTENLSLRQRVIQSGIVSELPKS